MTYHPDMDLAQLFERVEWCRVHECLPYVMRDAACWDCKISEFLIDYTAYCNQPAFFKKMNFEGFLEVRHPANPERRARSLQTYESAKEGRQHGLYK